MCFKEKKNKIGCGLLSPYSLGQGQDLVALPFLPESPLPQDWWHNQQGLSKDLRAEENPFASPGLSLALNPEGLLADSCPAKTEGAVSARVWALSFLILGIFFHSYCRAQANQAAAEGS